MKGLLVILSLVAASTAFPMFIDTNAFSALSNLKFLNFANQLAQQLQKMGADSEEPIISPAAEEETDSDELTPYEDAIDSEEIIPYKVEADVGSEAFVPYKVAEPAVESEPIVPYKVLGSEEEPIIMPA